jgi:hypothetical protein
MTSSRRSVTIVVHAAGWVVLVATAMASRSGLLGGGSVRATWLLVGLLVFAAMAAWSGSWLLAEFEPRPRPAVSALRPTVATIEPAAMMSQLVAGGFGVTTIRRSDGADPGDGFDGRIGPQPHSDDRAA